MSNFLEVVQQKVKLVEDRRKLICSPRMNKIVHRFMKEDGLNINFFVFNTMDNELKNRIINEISPYISYREHLGNITKHCIIAGDVKKFILSPIFVPFFASPYASKFLKHHKLKKKYKEDTLWSVGYNCYVVPFLATVLGEILVEARFQCAKREQISIFQEMYDYIVYDRKRMNGTFIE